MDSAVIFDVDGVLLELTSAEEDAFFQVFARRYGLTGLSRDWNSYRIRNDEHIIAEILERHRLPPSEHAALVADYLAILGQGLTGGNVPAVEIDGAADMLRALSSHRLGIATANLLPAARLRLQSRGLWPMVSGLAFGAEGSGHKRDTVARAVAASGIPRQRIVYVGDNLNDLEAGKDNGVAFIGFSIDPVRRQRLASAGATHLSGHHATTLRLIGQLLQAR
jgi:phosphoglycolate phosphatase-like HAD superfamily hydrolase